MLSAYAVLGGSPGRRPSRCPSYCRRPRSPALGGAPPARGLGARRAGRSRALPRPRRTPPGRNERSCSGGQARVWVHAADTLAMERRGSAQPARPVAASCIGRAWAFRPAVPRSLSRPPLSQSQGKQAPRCCFARKSGRLADHDESGRRGEGGLCARRRRHRVKRARDRGGCIKNRDRLSRLVFAPGHCGRSAKAPCSITGSPGFAAAGQIQTIDAGGPSMQARIDSWRSLRDGIAGDDGWPLYLQRFAELFGTEG